MKLADKAQKHKGKAKQATVTPIVSSTILERLQINLIDYSRRRNRGYGFVLHIEDHFSKFTALYPLVDKSAANVKRKFERWMGLFGVPRLVQSDNRGEFQGVLEVLLEEEGIEIAHG